MRITLRILIFLISISGAVARDVLPDTIINLKDVRIYSSRINRFAKGQEVQKLDSLTRAEYPGGSLAELINGFTSAYVRNYGQGTLSTLSLRGTSANHTALLWNGIRISPPNIGYLDLSLVQGGFFKDISVLYGGASPMFGSGSIGGSIHLENSPVFEKSGFDGTLDLSAGSFGSMAIEANGSVCRPEFYSRTAFSIINSNNDFSYDNLQGEKEKLPHASIFKSGFIQDIAYKIAPDQYLMASAWFQYANRNIPPTLTEASSEANQNDRSWRTMILWKDYHESYNLEARLAYFNEYTRYTDPPASVYSIIISQSLTGAFESTWNIAKNSDIFAGSQFTYEYADLVNYEHPRDQQNLAVYASYRHNFPSFKWQASLNGRQEFLTGYQSPFLFSAGAEGSIWRFISGRLNVSRNFRAPTLNERYWQPGGDPDLKPEESWNEEAGITLENQFALCDLKFGLTAFNSNVDNWILWLQTPGASYWSAENAQDVWSRGFELSGNQSMRLGEINIFLLESYTYSKSTNEKKLFELDASYKKQLIYTPLNRFVIKAGALYKGFNLTLNGGFTGETFTTKDNFESLPPYFIMDIIVSKTFKMKKEYPLTVQFNLNNVLNKDYEVVPYRPMPGINFLVTVKVAVVGHQSLVISH
jgi:iron complex outermembrane receptor protein